MFSSLLDRMGATPRSSSQADETRASSSDTMLTTLTVDADADADSNVPFCSSTPPTSIGDSVSVSSASVKLDTTDSAPIGLSSRRSDRKRSLCNYNVKVLSGTAIHSPRKYLKNAENAGGEARRRNISGDTLVDSLTSGNASSVTIENDAKRLVHDGIEALDLEWTVKKLPKSRSQIGLLQSPKRGSKQANPERLNSMRSSGETVGKLTKKLGVLGKRGRKTFEDGLAGITKVKRELRNLADTNEYAKIETKPVIHEVWSKGKLVTAEPPKKKKKVDEAAVIAASPPKAETSRPADRKKTSGKREKVWLNKGLYAGQKRNLDWFQVQSGAAKDDTGDITDTKPNSFMPLPMWHGQRLLHVGRHFKLPFDVCSPLPPGQPKPDEWRKTSSNRFIGEAGALWKKFSLFDSFSSKCVCTTASRCDEDCQNRIMLYECDDTNCAVGRDRCTNRSFSQLQERRKAGGKYRIGVEVIKTGDRGYGVRSNRGFDAHQIIVEYTGEIITEDECDRRMNEDYKENDCYYLMSFDQNMIIDATKGSIARFVNHSCKPNCRMVKWIVGGKPRMALFAGDKPIMTGDELTYDYNFDPFSAKNVQECRCGSENCRGILGPRPKDQKFVKETIKEVMKAGVKAGKRKLKELLGGDGEKDDELSRSPKKRKIKEATGVKRSTSSAGIQMAKGAARAVKKSVSARFRSARQPVSSKRRSVVAVKTKKVKTYSRHAKPSSRNSSITVVEGSSPNIAKTKRVISRQRGTRKQVVKGKRGSKHVLSDDEDTIRVVADPGEMGED